MKNRTTPMNTREVPIALRDKFKAYCARRGYTMQGAVIALMRMAVNDDMKLTDAKKRNRQDGAR